MAAPRWVPRFVLDSVHLDQLREHGGLPGIRDEDALEAALARPQQKHHDEPDADLATLAAGLLGEPALATWMRERLVRYRP